MPYINYLGIYPIIESMSETIIIPTDKMSVSTAIWIASSGELEVRHIQHAYTAQRTMRL